MNTVKDLTDHLARTGDSPEKLAREIKISNMTIRRLLRRPPETPLPEKYRLLIRVKHGSSLFNKASDPNAPAAQLTGILDARRGQSFTQIVSELETKGSSSVATAESIEKLEADLALKLEDKAIDGTLRKRVSKVTALLKAGRLTLKEKAILAGALLYLINPIDLIPDTIPVVGYLDDLAVVTLACDAVAKGVKRRAKANAETAQA